MNIQGLPNYAADRKAAALAVAATPGNEARSLEDQVPCVCGIIDIRRSEVAVGTTAQAGAGVVVVACTGKR